MTSAGGYVHCTIHVLCGIGTERNVQIKIKKKVLWIWHVIKYMLTNVLRWIAEQTHVLRCFLLSDFWIPGIEEFCCFRNHYCESRLMTDLNMTSKIKVQTQPLSSCFCHVSWDTLYLFWGKYCFQYIKKVLGKFIFLKIITPLDSLRADETFWPCSAFSFN